LINEPLPVTLAIASPEICSRVSISPSIARISGAFGSFTKIASHSCNEFEYDPTLKYTSASLREVRNESSCLPIFW
jgi:hypothetical protein